MPVSVSTLLPSPRPARVLHAEHMCGLCMQVLLSQVHRLRALVLLGRFLDMGRWAVDLALSVGIFPYVLKLLQTTAPDLRQTLVFIWTKILALDRSCQVSLLLLNLCADVLALHLCFLVDCPSCGPGPCLHNPLYASSCDHVSARLCIVMVYMQGLGLSHCHTLPVCAMYKQDFLRQRLS